MLFNKKGDEVILSPWNVIIWVLLIGALVIGLVIFNNSKTDIRSEEARILALRVADCIIEDSRVMPLPEDFNIFETCHLSQEVIEESGGYFIKIEVIDLYSKEELASYSTGDKDLELQCALKTEEKHFAVCYREKVFSNGFQNEPLDLIVKITTASNYQEDLNE